MEEDNSAESGEFPLPESIVQHIQSFLNDKQAAQTTVLSKLWYNAWLTRPILDIDELNFSKRGDRDPESRIGDGFWEFARRAVERYQELNLKIESFRLSMKNVSDRNSLVNELIVKVLKMGVNDFNFEITNPDSKFFLPHEVLGSENLTGLSLSGCTIDPPMDGKISCSGLKSLSLSKVCIVNYIVWDIISSCPLIENLSLSECQCLLGVNSLGNNVTQLLRWRAPSAESCELHKLKYLSLHRITVDSLFFHDFSRKFPCLEDLSILCCYGYKGIRLSSHSLKSIILDQTRMLRARFDVPSIEKFTYTGFSIPSVSFPTASGEWESNIRISCSEYRLCAKWFGDLKKLLTKLSLSKISLNLEFYLEKCIDCEGLIEGLPKPDVENLMLSFYTRSTVRSSVLDGLFWCCRPKFITQCWTLRSCITDKENNDFLELICKRLIPEANQNCSIPTQSLSDLHDLQEVSIEIFEQTLAEWQPLPWKSLLEASSDPELAQRVRFRLKWSSPDHASSSSRPLPVVRCNPYGPNFRKKRRTD